MPKLLELQENRDRRIVNPAEPMAKEYPDDFSVDLHAHARAQLVYAVTGVMELATADKLWIVPPQRAVWMPAKVPHRMRTKGPVSLRTLYLRPEAYPRDFPVEPRTVSVTLLLRELIDRVTSIPVDHAPDSRESRLINVLVDEITFTDEPALQVRFSGDRRLRRVCDGILRDPTDNRTLEAWAISTGSSSRTLARLFLSELGVSFSQWRQQARLVAALPRLAAGESISAIAADFGYETPGAFSAMFRRYLGSTPSAYFKMSGLTK